MNLKPRSLASLDPVKLFDEGCVRTYRNKLIQDIIAKKAQEQTHREALQARKKFKTYEGFKLPKGKNLEEVYGEQARKEANKIIEQERHILAESKKEWLLRELKKNRNTLKLFMLVVDEEGNIVKPTFVGNTVEHGDVKYKESYASFFGEKDPDRLNIVNNLKKQVANIAYLIPYSSHEVKALVAEINELATPDHYEVCVQGRLVQVYGGKYAKEDEGLTDEEWREKVAQRAKDIIAEKAKKASE